MGYGGATASGATVTIPQVKGLVDQRPFGIVSVTEFGAKMDGVTDDREAVQKAVDAGSTVIFPPGVCRLGDTVYLKSGTTILGSGDGATTIILDSGATSRYAFRALGSKDNRMSDIRVANLHFDGSDLPFEPGSAAIGVRFDYCDNVSLAQLSGANLAHVAWLNEVDVFEMHNLRVSNALGSVASCFSVTNGTVQDIHAHNSGEALDFNRSQNVVIDGVVATASSGNEDEAIDLGSCDEFVVSNVVAHGFQRGITVKTEDTAWKNIHIDNCTITGFSQFGIMASIVNDVANACENIQVTNCTLISEVSGAAGIRYAGSTVTADKPILHAGVSGCHIDVPSDGIILLRRIERSKLQGNTIICGGSAINIGEACHNVTVSTNDLEADGYGVVSEYPDNRRILVRGNDFRTGDQTVRIQYAYDIAVEANRIWECGGSTAILVQNCGAVRVRDNEVHASDGRGVYLLWTSDARLDSVQRIVGAVVDNNVIHDWSSNEGIFINLNLSGVTGVYSVVSCSGNRLWLGNDTMLTNQTGIAFGRGSLDSVDYVKCDNNLIYNVPTPIDTTALGPNSTTENNTTKSVT